MHNNKKFREILNLYGRKFHELETFYEKWEKSDGKVTDEFCKLSVPPTRIFIEPTNMCNKNCKYYPHSPMKRDVSFLTFEDFKRMVQGIPKGTYITMTGNGEPLLNPNIYKMIEHAVKEGFVVGIITNGTALTRGNAAKLINTGIHRVQISFDSVFRDAFNDSYNSPVGAISYEATFKKVLEFIYMARVGNFKSSPFITIAAVMTDKVKEKNETTKRFWQSVPVDNYYEGELLTLQTDSGTFNDSEELEEKWKVCVNPFTSLKINADGSVNACIQDFSNKYSIGSVKDGSLLEIINSEKALKLRRALFEEDHKFLAEIGYNCKDCNAWKSCAKHDIKGYLENSFPITYALMVHEVSERADYSESKIGALMRAIEKFDQLIEELNG